MIKHWFKRMATAIAISAAFITALPASSTVLLTENFEYPAGNLCGTGGWYYLGTQREAPIQVVTPGLTYPGYQETAVGNSVKLTHLDNQDEDLARKFDNDAVINTPGDKIYFSFLANVTEVNDAVYVATLAGPGSAGMTQGKTLNWDGARVFISKGDTEGTYKVGFSKYTSSPVAYSNDIQLGETSLVVVCLEIVDGATNDKASFWVNPTAGSEEPEALVTVSDKADPNQTRGIAGVQLRQGSTASKTGPTLTVDALRAATTWAELFGGEGGGTPDKPDKPGTATITVPATVDFGIQYQYSTATQTINVKATGLTGDITVSSSTNEVKPSTSTIPMDEAMSTEGYNLTLTYKAESATLSGNLTLTAEGADNVTVEYTSDVVAVSPFANFRQIANLKADEVYVFQGKATVTHTDAANNQIYAQDIYGGGALLDISFLDGTQLKKGDRITNFYCITGEESLGVTPLLLISAPQITAQDVTVEPLELTFDELSRNPEDYINRLVKINDVDFGSKAGEKFTAAGIDVATASGNGKVRAFASTDIIGTEIPAKATSVTGISTSATAAVVSMRSLADIVAETAPAEEPTLEVERQMLMDANEYQEIGKSVAFGKLTVKYTDLPKAASIWLGGSNRNMFSIDTDVIPAGSGTVEITITYTPTTTGRHTATVNIDATPTQLSQSIAISARAYNPEVMPEISVDSSNLTEFVTDVNVPVKQTITYSVANLLDYGTVRVAQKAAGAFQISTTSTLKNVKDATLTITFNPKTEGTFTEDIIFESDLVEPVSFTVTGRTTGAPAPPAEREGDEFTMASFDTTNARALLIEDFQDCGASNKPLHIDGWTNAAVTGNRAWWAYKELDSDNFAAKVTAYDSKATESTDASMLLLTPPLDFVNAKQPLLTFRVMGKMMTANMFDNLQVIYIEPATEEVRILEAKPLDTGSPLDNVWAQPIEGLGLPASPDYNNQWMDYVIDLKNQDLADVFFIGFGYTSLRGTETTVQYLIDDFSWGRDDIAFIRPSQQWLDMEATAGIDNVSDPIGVEGLNLSGPVTLKVSGPNASKFSVEPAELPATGGQFKVHFNSDEIGVHAAYIELTSEGAPLALISVEANNHVNAAISGIATDSNEKVDVYNLQGIRLMHNVSPAEAIKQLPAGLYIMGGKKIHVR